MVVLARAAAYWQGVRQLRCLEDLGAATGEFAGKELESELALNRTW
jgi:hypothetical protein